MLLRTVISANQLSVYGAVADLCNELSEEFWASGKPAAPDHLETMAIRTDPSVAGPHTNEQQQGNLVQNYERRFEHMSDDQKLSKLCPDAGLKPVERGQYFYTLDTEGSNEMEHLCREYTMPRNEKKTRAKGWILKSTRFGPVLNIKVCHHEDQYTIAILGEYLFRDKTASRVRIVNGIDQFVTESMETKEEEEHRASGRPVARARPRLKPAVTLSSVSIPIRDRKWIDIETQRSHDQKCFAVSKAMTRLLRHDQTVPREDDGAGLYGDIIEECRKKKLDGPSQWPLEQWISTLAKGGGAKKRFQSCLNPNSPRHFLYFRAIQGYSGGNAIDPTLQDNVLLPKGITEYIYHIGNVSEMNSIIRNGLIPGGKSLKRGRQAVFFTAVNPMDDGKGTGDTPRVLTKPRIAPYKNSLKRLQNTVCWCNFKFAQERGLRFYQTRSHAIVLYNTLPAICIEKKVCLKTKEEVFQKIHSTPRLPRAVLKSNSQYGQQDPRDQDARSSWDPSCDSKSYGETCSNIVDYRIYGVPLSAVEQQNTTRENKAKKLKEKFESHPHKESLLEDLSQTQKINKFIEKWKDLLADMNNTEIFERCENYSKQQCTDCNSYWEIDIVYCSCARIF